MSRMSRLLDQRGQENLGNHHRVKCMHHGLTNGFACCKHVLDGTAPTFWIEDIGKSHPTMGMILCRDCTAVGGGAKVYLEQRDMGLACETCAREKGIARIGGRINIARESDAPLVIDTAAPADGADPAQEASPEATKEESPWAFKN